MIVVEVVIFTIGFKFSFAISSLSDVISLSLIIYRSEKLMFWRISYVDFDGITDLDFDPNGQLAATIDYGGVCLISEINTNNYSFHLDIRGRQGKVLFHWEMEFQPIIPPQNNKFHN
jgi:hypothetical protein